MASIQRIAQSTSVTFHHVHASEPLPSMVTRARGTILALADKYGEDHAIDVLRAITASPENSHELYQMTISAVSLFLREGAYQGQDLEIAKDVIKAVDLAKLRHDVMKTNLEHANVRMADRLVALTQEPVF